MTQASGIWSGISPQCVDNRKPTAVNILPTAGNTAVYIDTYVNITFDEQMNKTTTENAFELADLNGNKVYGNFSWVDNMANNEQQMRFKPVHKLSESLDFLIKLDITATDLAGNPLGFKYQIPFTTRDDTRPTIKSTDPDADEKGVEPSSNIFVEFDETMIVETVNRNFSMVVNSGPYEGTALTNGTYAWSNSNQIFRYVFPTNHTLLSFTQYKITIGNATDRSGNILQGEPYTWIFTTRDTASPYVVSTDPANGAVEVREEDACVRACTR